MLVLLKLVFGVTIVGNFWLLCGALLAFQGPALGLGLILTAEARNQAQAQQLAYFVFLPNILLSGLVFPRESMPAGCPGVEWVAAHHLVDADHARDCFARCDPGGAGRSVSGNARTHRTFHYRRKMAACQAP